MERNQGDERMSATIAGSTLSLLAELESSAAEIIERHFAADEKRAIQTLIHYGPFEVRVYGADGCLARFMEEGLEIYPDVTQ